MGYDYGMKRIIAVFMSIAIFYGCAQSSLYQTSSSSRYGTTERYKDYSYENLCKEAVVYSIKNQKAYWSGVNSPAKKEALKRSLTPEMCSQYATLQGHYKTTGITGADKNIYKDLSKIQLCRITTQRYEGYEGLFWIDDYDMGMAVSEARGRGLNPNDCPGGLHTTASTSLDATTEKSQYEELEGDMWCLNSYGTLSRGDSSAQGCHGFQEVKDVKNFCRSIYLSHENKQVCDVFKITDSTTTQKTQIVSTSEPTTTQVVQVPESKVDKEAPVLEIEDHITVTERNYSISGKVVDESQAFIEADSFFIPINNNTFTLQGAAPIGLSEIHVVAFDQWGNETSKKIIIERTIKTADSTHSFQELNPGKLISTSNKDRIALIIGIEEYENISNANFAKRDAEYFIDYVQGAFGVPQSNIKYFFNDNAKRDSKFEIKQWLKKNIRNNTEVYMYFSGHGLAVDDGRELYLLANDTRPDFIEDTAINRNEIFNDIAQYNPQSVTAFLDTCYSGAGRADGQMLLVMAKGLVVVDEQQQKLPDNFTLFTAASAQESAWSLPEAEHGTFSYFLMKGMEGNADLNGDKKLTNGELRDYLLDNVGRYAQQQQTPQMVGDPNEVLMRF